MLPEFSRELSRLRAQPSVDEVANRMRRAAGRLRAATTPHDVDVATARALMWLRIAFEPHTMGFAQLSAADAAEQALVAALAECADLRRLLCEGAAADRIRESLCAVSPPTPGPSLKSRMFEYYRLRGECVPHFAALRQVLDRTQPTLAENPSEAARKRFRSQVAEACTVAGERLSRSGAGTASAWAALLGGTATAVEAAALSWVWLKTDPNRSQDDWPWHVATHGLGLEFFPDPALHGLLAAPSLLPADVAARLYRSSCARTWTLVRLGPALPSDRDPAMLLATMRQLADDVPLAGLLATARDVIAPARV